MATISAITDSTAALASLKDQTVEVDNAPTLTLPPTNLLYLTWEGNFQLECRATVLQCTIIDNKHDQTPNNTAATTHTNKKQVVVKDEDGISVQIALDQTVLHAQGGGQPTDFGTLRVIRESSSSLLDNKNKNNNNNNNKDPKDDILLIQIHQVLLDRATGVALHTGRIATTTTTATIPNVGDQVQVVVEANRRQILSECHTAGHVVDAAMARCQLYFPPMKAYHYLEGPYVEYQGTLQNNTNNNNNESLLASLQQAFAQLVEEDLETKIHLITSQAEAQAMCHPLVAAQIVMPETATTNGKEQELQQQQPQQQPIRIVTVAGWSCPCGGTHIQRTGLLKERKWNITGIKSKKGVVRVKYNYVNSVAIKT